MALEKRKSEQEEISKENRLKQIQKMRERLDNRVANENRDIRTKNISNNTHKLIQEKRAELPAPSREPDKGKSMER
ncbi:hypothetical protein [Seonamhaeicola marinus]|uniref:Uncharacterized protein n=1 Tax=Seonamhaeicola marinus TaxID=1912246 RepID=A0A5D0HUE8_9FLAO|nr:hypothetical protein [Seonamhaeicola marinus]TYA74945.1 hypothetical protein FUA24_16735 [Seonamhaeicola marinus]